jgi:hypothetical protein
LIAALKVPDEAKILEIGVLRFNFIGFFVCCKFSIPHYPNKLFPQA